MLLWFGVLALKTGFPPRRDVGYDWALDRAHLWRNGVEHLERSAELRGRAVVDNENEEGETKSEVDHLGWNGTEWNVGRVHSKIVFRRKFYGHRNRTGTLWFSEAG